MKKSLKSIIGISTGIIVLFIGLTAIEIFTGGNSLYRWDVQVRMDVRDELDGTELPNYRLQYSMFDFNNYRDAILSKDIYVVTMQYCRGEGLISSLFNDKAIPQPGFYTFKISVQGYEDELVDGKNGKIRSLNNKGKYELILPKIRLHKLNS